MANARLLSDKVIRLFDRGLKNRRYVVITGKKENLNAVCGLHGTFRGIYKTFDRAQKELMRRGWEPGGYYGTMRGGHFIWEHGDLVAIIVDVAIK